MNITKIYPDVSEGVNEHGEIIECYDHPATLDLLWKCGLESIDVYIARHRETIKSWILENDPELYNKCKASKEHNTNHGQVVWWELPTLEEVVQESYFRTPATQSEVVVV